MIDLCEKLGDIESDTKLIRSDSVTVSDERTMFDSFIACHPLTKSGPATRATIMGDVNLKAGRVKEHSKKEKSLSAIWRRVILHVLRMPCRSK